MVHRRLACLLHKAAAFCIAINTDKSPRGYAALVIFVHSAEARVWRGTPLLAELLAKVRRTGRVRAAKTQASAFFRVRTRVPTRVHAGTRALVKRLTRYHVVVTKVERVSQ